MKALTLALMAVLPAAMTLAQEKSASPQPRVRLDPQTRTAVAEPAAAGAPTGRVATPSVVLMDRYVVKGQGGVPLGPQPLAQATGPFRLSEGGRLYQKELGAAQVEVGMWSYADILADDANFKGPPKRASWEFLHVKW